MFINAIAAIASADIALLIIIQFLFGQAIKTNKKHTDIMEEINNKTNMPTV